MNESTVMKPIWKYSRYEPGTFADERYSRIYGAGIRHEAFMSPRLKVNVCPFATKAGSTASGENHDLNQKHPNHTLHTNGSPRGLLKSAAIISPAQSRILLPQPPRLRLAPICCHLPVSESRG
jgi:hypothetical protein